MRTAITLAAWFSLALIGGGFFLVGYEANVFAAVGVFMMIWGNNISNKHNQ